jgi:hypothetical protein
MKLVTKTLLACTLVIAFLAPAAHGQVNLLTPPDGAAVSDPPAFSWSGPFDAWLFISVFYYDITGVYTGYFPAQFWLFDPGFAMPGSWWDSVGEGNTNFWAVLGVDQATGGFGVSDLGTWTRAGCEGQCWPNYTFDCNEEVNCVCFRTTEGDGRCIDDFFCDTWPSCSSTADCAAGSVCITCTACSGNRCAPDQCTDGGPNRALGLDSSGPTAAGQ